MIEAIFDLLKLTPIWVGPILATAAFVLFRYVLPLLIPAKHGAFDMGPVFRPLLSMFSWVAAAAIIMAWLVAEVWKLSNRRLLDRQTSVESLTDISWREFERLVCEAYRRKGYVAEVVGSESGDGGVDIRLNGHGETVLVQCKQWKAYKVGVTVIREMLGVVVSEEADKGVVVTSGLFTEEAEQFAQKNSKIQLMDGPELTDLIRGVQSVSKAGPPNLPKSDKTSPPRCPSCEEEMVLRTSRKGPHKGSQFWGCPTYPTCKGTRAYPST